MDSKPVDRNESAMLGQPFLNRLADDLREERNEPQVVVLPNKRSLFVLQALVGESNPNRQFFTADEFVAAVTEFRLIEAEELLVTFFQVYRKLEKVPQPFDTFSKWAVPLVRDFNECDLSLADPDRLFDYIKAWHETGEGFTEGEAGAVEKSFLSFWERIPRYYKGLKAELAKLKLAYRGMLYRLWAEAAPIESLAEKTLFWVGLVPGNPAERQALDQLVDKTKIRVFADTDDWYLKHPMHEAGRLFKDDPLFKEHQWSVDLLTKAPYDFHICPVAGHVAQVQLASQTVKAIPAQNWSQTAIVLLDDQLLIPLLDQLRDFKGKVNVTMGYPLRETQIHRFVMAIMQLHAGARSPAGGKAFYHHHFESLLQFQLVQEWFDQSVSWWSIQRELVKSNLRYIPISWLRERMVTDLFGSELFDLLFDWPPSPFESFERLSQVLSHWEKQVIKRRQRLERRAIQAYLERLKLLTAQFNDVMEDSSYSTLRKFVHRQVGYSKLFFEEPENDALQVMGMLETRLLDFKNLIFIGTSEQLFPGSLHRQTFVPYMHRKAFGMPVQGDTEGLISYHFFRLLQRSKKAWFVYNSVSDAFNSGEPSPYILQIKEELARENDQLSIEESNPVAADAKQSDSVLSIAKSEAVVDDLRSYLEKKVSPSAINTFVNSPLEFYFYYVLGLREQETVEEEVEASTLGSIVHEVLENIYKPAVGRMLDPEMLVKGEEEAKVRVRTAFLEQFPKEDIDQGKNLLRVALATRFVENFLKSDRDELALKGPLHLQSLEDLLQARFEFQGVNLRMMGFADRIDERQGHFRIVDYKTGLVEPRELRFEPEEFPHEPKWSKAFQLSFYKWAFCKQKNLDPLRVKASIVSFRNQQKGYLYLNERGREQTFMADFERCLATILGEMLDKDQAFEHRPESKYITF